MSGATLSIVNGTVFDGDSPELIEGAVHVADGRIVEVGAAARPADRVIDARGATVLPGLIDAHFHAYGISLDLLAIESRPPSYVALSGARRLAAALARGFTTVRDVAGGDAGLARAIGEGLIAAPRYLYTGPALSQTGGHGDARAADGDLCGCHEFLNEVVDGVDPLRRAVRDRFRRGAHAIKIMTSGGVVSLTDPIRVPQYSPEEVTAVTEEARRRGSYVAAHAYSPEAIRHSVGNGVRSIEHGNLLDAETAALMARHDAFLVPTLVAYDAMERRGAELGMAPESRAKNREVLNSGREAIELARAAGVRIGFGTDLMGALEDEQLGGLRLQTEVEGPLRTLRSATSVNADLLRRPDLGRVQAGCVADLLIVDGDPFTDPSVLWGPPERRRVIQAGEPL
jgi:imidazolonepropionase-like amidohydrolase